MNHNTVENSMLINHKKAQSVHIPVNVADLEEFFHSKVLRAVSIIAWLTIAESILNKVYVL